MNCRELAELLCDFVGDELTAEQRRQVEQHLCNCPPCAVYVETYCLTITLTKKLPCTPLPPELEQRCQAILKQAVEKSKEEKH
jgi:anti-sigma factor RsiW